MRVLSRGQCNRGVCPKRSGSNVDVEVISRWSAGLSTFFFKGLGRAIEVPVEVVQCRMSDIVLNTVVPPAKHRITGSKRKGEHSTARFRY